MRITSLKNLSALFIMFALAMSLTTACSKSDDNEGVSEAVVNSMAGTYKATIAPTMGNKKMAEGPHTIYIERVAGTQQVRMHYENFNAPFLDGNGKPSETARMPFDMTVDFTFVATPGENGAVALKSIKGYFKAAPHNGNSVDPKHLPGGITIPNPNGFETDKATAEGTWKDNKLVLRILPNVLPVVVNVEAAKQQN